MSVREYLAFVQRRIDTDEVRACLGEVLAARPIHGKTSGGSPGGMVAANALLAAPVEQAISAAHLRWQRAAYPSAAALEGKGAHDDHNVAR
jgi:hypothetical protein